MLSSISIPYKKREGFSTLNGWNLTAEKGTDGALTHGKHIYVNISYEWYTESTVVLAGNVKVLWSLLVLFGC